MTEPVLMLQPASAGFSICITLTHYPTAAADLRPCPALDTPGKAAVGQPMHSSLPRCSCPAEAWCAQLQPTATANAQ